MLLFYVSLLLCTRWWSVWLLVLKSLSIFGSLFLYMFCFSFACRLWLDILIIFLWSILFIQLFFWISSSSFRNYPSGCDLSIQLYEQRKMIYWLKRLTMEVIKKENNRHLSFQIGIKQGHHMMLLLIFLAQEECSRPPITSFFTDITSNFRIAYLHDQVSSYFVISFLLLFSFFLLFFLRGICVAWSVLVWWTTIFPYDSTAHF